MTSISQILYADAWKYLERLDKSELIELVNEDVAPQQPETFKMLGCAREALVTLNLADQPLYKWVSDFNY